VTEAHLFTLTQGDHPMSYPLTEIEKDIRPEDFREDSPWPEFIKEFGPGPMVWLSKMMQGDRPYIPDYDNMTKASRKRSYRVPQKTA